MSKIKQFLQFILSLLRKIGIDPYKAYISYRQASVWRKSLPEKQLRTDGICLAFDVFQLTSFSQVGRDFVDMLSQTDIPFEVFDTDIGMSCSSYISEEEKEKYRKYLTQVIRQKKVLTFTVMPFKKSTKFINALVPFWEFESGFIEAFPKVFDGVRFVAPSSDFCLECMKKTAPAGVGVQKVRYPFPLGRRVCTSVQKVRCKYGIPETSFLAVFNFSYGSCYERKNPEAILTAFAKAFPNDEDVRLIIKTAHSQSSTEKSHAIRLLIKKLCLENKVVVVDDYMPHSDLIDLFAASDVYISLHRGEGLGLGMLESMSVGTPVICTRYGGNLDFCKETTSFLVNVSKVVAATDFPFYRYVADWAEPDIDQAAYYLRKIYENPDIGKQKSVAATLFINEFYSVKNFEKDVRAFIKKLDIED